MLPNVTKDPRDWTAKERYYVITHRHEWIQRCLDYWEEEKQRKKFLDFINAKQNRCFISTIHLTWRRITSFLTMK